MPDLPLEPRPWIGSPLLLVRKYGEKSVWKGIPFLFICDIKWMGQKAMEDSCYDAKRIQKNNEENLCLQRLQ